MIRFPERFHASATPGAARIEPNWLEEPPRPSDREPVRHNAGGGERRPRFDFTAILAVLGR